MATMIAMPDGIYYRVNHPEFKKDLAYKALFFTQYAESGWDYLTFINDRGMTYSVKNWRCFCMNGQRIDTHGNKVLYFCEQVPLGTPLWFCYHSGFTALPFPKPSCKNPDLADD